MELTAFWLMRMRLKLFHEMIVDEDGVVDMYTDHNILILNYGFKGNCDRNAKENNNRLGFK